SYTVTGTLPTRGDVLVLAWSDSERRLVSAFAHTMTDSPWQISAAKMDLLPEGRTNLQLIVRENGRELARSTHWLEVTRPVEVAPEVSFSANTPGTYMEGSGQAIDF